MSSSDHTRRAALGLIGAGLGVGACGFTPVYAPGADAAQLRGTVAYDEPSNPDQFDIARNIEQRFGMPTSPRYGLVINPVVRSESLAVAAEENITRYDLTGTARYTLRDLGTGKALISGRVESFTSYSATGSTTSTLAAEREARSRLMVALSDLVIVRLISEADKLPA